MDQAFSRLRAHARNRNEGLTDVATSVVVNVLHISELDFPALPRSH
jgi:AmiR/NasT family two-component response regulator